MIPRYSRPHMAQLWTEENKFHTWLQVELAALEAMALYDLIPKTAVAHIREKARFDVARIEEIEAQTKHDVIAFLTNVAEYVGEDSRYLHYALTSSDILDTALALRLRQAADILLSDLDQIMAVLKDRAYEFKHTPCIGRSHGIHAEPTTFGLKFALWYARNATESGTPSPGSGSYQRRQIFRCRGHLRPSAPPGGREGLRPAGP